MNITLGNLLFVSLLLGLFYVIFVLPTVEPRLRNSDEWMFGTLTQIHTQAEVYNAEKGNFEGICESEIVINLITEIKEQKMLKDHSKEVFCNDGVENYIVQSILPNELPKEVKYVCISNNSGGIVLSKELSPNDMDCIPYNL